MLVSFALPSTAVVAACLNFECISFALLTFLFSDIFCFSDFFGDRMLRDRTDGQTDGQTDIGTDRLFLKNIILNDIFPGFFQYNMLKYVITFII